MLTNLVSTILVLMFVLAFIAEGLSFGYGLEITLAAAFTAGLLASEVVRRILGNDDGGPSSPGSPHPVLA
ncbi:hypothetical protein [Amycolatopsis pigmentata]|uniref:Uncharacterized protein n=1 Tax=Amycolatopsis pigmentata TaxID=450801 RepID=A0ABW5FWP3_9PSEU